jgi:hypothetical protein
MTLSQRASLGAGRMQSDASARQSLLGLRSSSYPADRVARFHHRVFIAQGAMQGQRLDSSLTRRAFAICLLGLIYCQLIFCQTDSCDEEQLYAAGVTNHNDRIARGRHVIADEPSDTAGVAADSFLGGC